ncbi:hypothetical protein A2707_03945 [Candidatus Saccharibacteria bacterium RIFCSPHIGHO2_01_FULL_45_15]|nr:MAG: hypothetical protein A2707_03945 [Candidatus Saccharibacteria bacterium RIFCSPHIGHO2_01_FULL_45_15]OGL31575.1 MAG: hypothetical protein A3E76_02475 [Candidatus Saccharibacteria bacterium RIFCSPHIGHO2_12_FULL_44_22]
MILKKVKLLLKNRIVLFFGFFTAILLLNFFSTGMLFPTTETKDLWFYSGIFMVLFTILFIEPYYSSPKNVITNTVPLILVFLAIKNDIADQTQWWVIISVLITLLVVSVIAMMLDDKNSSPTAFRNKLSERLKNIAIFFGKGKRLYSAIFLYFLLVYYVGQNDLNWYVFCLLVIWAFILLIDQNDLTNAFVGSKKEKDKSAIGQIFGIESQKMFLVKLFNDSRSLKKFDVVKFNYSMRNTQKTYTGVVFDHHLLNQEQWIKVLWLGECKTYTKHLIDDTVYITSGEEKNDLLQELEIDNFAGVVVEGSEIGKIKFEYSKKEDNLQEGDLLELKVGDMRLFYQVVSGTTNKEHLEARNESGFIIGEAVQLGEWRGNELSFNKFGWVPQINTPIFMAKTADLDVPKYSLPDYKLGNIPGTTLPSIINLDEAISHHTALLGITGSGKSHLAREIVRELSSNTKVIIVDFTGEWARELDDLSIENMAVGGGNIDDFLKDESKPIGIITVPDMSNTEDILDQTQKLFERVFNFAKQKYQDDEPCKIALVLEEAHTITPEANFLGVGGDFGKAKAIISKMSQIALQGRKYGVGMLVIAQRTANVSKTVLTQCNTVICFQAYDETSFNFLGNYVGKSFVEALPNLKQYHAIVTGKAVRSNMPMIIDLTKEP